MELGLPEHLMLSLGAADRHARLAPHCRSCTTFYQYMPRSLAVVIHVAMATSIFYLLVQGVAQPGLESLAGAALVPPRLRLRCRRRLLEVRYYWSCPRSVVPV